MTCDYCDEPYEVFSGMDPTGAVHRGCRDHAQQAHDDTYGVMPEPEPEPARVTTVTGPTVPKTTALATPPDDDSDED